MNIKIALVAFSITFAGFTQVEAQQNNNAATVATVTKPQFTANINAYEQANGANSTTVLTTLKSQMRTAIADLKESMSNGGGTTQETKMQSRINAFNNAVQKEKANDKSGVVTALKAFAETL
ncbi:hypothetical protein DBR32_02025 [Taibaiella sp. KBW10]|uniref:hypothetical protein n=1 Tax=Taibaiella sp. KBW10 TaxID=2153357 RepID=UPI000F5B3BA6|nr:hypothetical protein [Taibaiella sp. KBW10]RQO32406.1 hypothetical protein DBR32_02025 [Taibaiella sp. KBW10]